ncbi:hypothetical protein DFH06DRAFT_1135308 [Mycena polygramma]|nr:hypothetical protein DFH06DRAFT_1135308 [Mycena polygramma]
MFFFRPWSLAFEDLFSLLTSPFWCWGLRPQGWVERREAPPPGKGSPSPRRRTQLNCKSEAPKRVHAQPSTCLGTVGIATRAFGRICAAQRSCGGLEEIVLETKLDGVKETGVVKESKFELVPRGATQGRIAWLSRAALHKLAESGLG